LFPIGCLTKTKLRAIAEQLELPTAKRKESMGICFVGKKRSFSNFLGMFKMEKGVCMDLTEHQMGTSPLARATSSHWMVKWSLDIKAYGNTQLAKMLEYPGNPSDSLCAPKM